MSKLGFKFSWETEDTTESNIHTNVSEQIIVSHILELNNKIQGCEEYIISNEFTTLTSREKLQVLDTYQFYIKTFILFDGEEVVSDVCD